MVWYSSILKNFPVCCDAHKGFSVVSEAEVDGFLELPCFLHDPKNVGNLTSGFSAFSKPSLYIRKFSSHILLKPSLKDFEHNLTSMCKSRNQKNLETKKRKKLWNKKIDRPLATATARKKKKKIAGPKTVSGMKEVCHYKHGKQIGEEGSG